jgi:hypothetical protein
VATNISVGYENNGTYDIATCWITDNNLNTLSKGLTQNIDSRALSLAQYGNTLFIVGYQPISANYQATLWTCDLQGNNIKALPLTTTASPSEANCIIWTGTYFYAAGYIENASKRYATVWQIDKSGKIINTITSQYESYIQGIALAGKLSYLALTGQVTIPELNIQNAACVFQFDISGQFTPLLVPKPLLNPDQSSTPAHGNSIIIENSTSQNPTFYIAGAYNTTANSKACLWKGNFWTLDALSSQSLSQVQAEAFDLTLVNNQLYVAGYLSNNGKKNAAIWTAPKDALSSFLNYSTSSFLYPQNLPFTNCISILNFIKGTLGSKNLPSFPLYAGGYFIFDLLPDAFYEKFSTTQNITNFGGNNLSNPPIVDLSNSTNAYNKEAFDMLIDVRSPPNNISTVLKLKKTSSYQKGVSR